MNVQNCSDIHTFYIKNRHFLINVSIYENMEVYYAVLCNIVNGEFDTCLKNGGFLLSRTWDGTHAVISEGTKTHTVLLSKVNIDHSFL